MSPDEMKAIVKRFVEEAQGKGNFSVLPETFAPEYIAHTPAWQGTGPDGYIPLLTAYRSAFPDLTARVDQLLVEGDTVGVRITWRGTHRGPFRGVAPTGKTFEATLMAFYRLQDGRIMEGWPVVPWLYIMEQLGIAPRPPAAG